MLARTLAPPMTDRLVDLTLRAFTDQLASDAPVPGGGSAAAYAGAVGAALAAMVARIASKKADDEAVRDYIVEVDNLRADFLRLVDDDSAAYARERGLPKAPAAAVSDIGVGALMAEAALRGAAMNVMINLSSLKDRGQVKALSEDLDRAVEGTDAQRKRITDFVESRIAR